MHVKPKTEKYAAQMEIFTVITGQKDSLGVQSFYVDEVESLSDENAFKIPDNINLFISKDSIKSILYPFYLNNKK